MNSRFKLPAVTLAIALVGSIAVGCGPATSPAPSVAQATSGSQTTPKSGGTLRVGLHAAAKAFDPHKNPNQPEYWIDELVYDYLVTLDKDLKIQPALATEWGVSADNLTWTFKLRKGVMFHNGRELKAADVKYSIERIQNPQTASSKRAAFASVASVQVPDDYTVVFRLTSPNAVLPVNLADPRTAIVAKEIVDAKGDLSQVDAGSGAFKLIGLDASGTITVERNASYWNPGKPYLDRVQLVPIPDNNARNTALRSGDVDMVTFVTTNYISLLRQESTVVVPETAISGQFYFFSMNTEVKPFSDAKVRQAMAYALDRKVITQISLNGEGVPLLGGPIPSWHWAASPPVYPEANLTKAKQLIAESSVPNGFEFTLRIWGPQDYVVRTSQLMQEQLAPLNIKPKIDQQGDYASYSAPIQKGDYMATIQGFGGNTDPDDWMFEAFHSKGGKNWARYKNPNLDKLLEQGRAESDQAKRKAIYDSAQTLVATEAPMIFLYNMRQTEAWRTQVKGFVHIPTMVLTSLRDTWLDK